MTAKNISTTTKDIITNKIKKADRIFLPALFYSIIDYYELVHSAH